MAIKRIHSRSPYYITSSDAPVPSPTLPIEYLGAECGDIAVSDGFIGKKIYTLVMTGDTGDININYSGGNIPVKISLAYDGALVTSGYVGLDAYDDQLIAAGVDPLEINTGPTSTKFGALVLPKNTESPLTATITVQTPLVNDTLNLTFTCPDEAPSTAPVCPDRALVFQVCNENSAKDDNFNIYLNDNFIGYLDLSQNAQVGGIFIATTNANANVTSGDFACPLELMVTNRFDPSFLVYGTNILEMRNAQLNNNGNMGTISVRNYLIDGDDLSSPCVVADMTFGGAPTGTSFTLSFDYIACCPIDLPDLIS
jgi:hypothetical protein